MLKTIVAVNGYFKDGVVSEKKKKKKKEDSVLGLVFVVEYGRGW